MSETRWNLLAEPLIGVEKPGGERTRLSLPEVMGWLGAGEDLAFTALQPHQHHAWYAFLVQLAAIATQRAGGGAVGRPADAWRSLLRALTGEREEAWCLVVDDLGQPAFMQPPVPEGTVDVLKNEARCADEVDVLVTAKNHDVKSARIGLARPEHWAFALVSLQTMQGFLGAGNWGIGAESDNSVVVPSENSVAPGTPQGRGK